MSEVEKIYENAGVKFIIGVHCRAKIGDECKSRCPDCDYNTKPKEYPPFTADKQLELIKWLSKRCFYIEISEMMNKSYGIALKYQPADEYKNEQSECCVNKNFTEALAESINYIWQDLTEQERIEIAEILRG